VIVAAVAFVIATLAAKWAAARLLFRLNLIGSVLLGLSPLIYLPGIVVTLFATASVSYRFSSVFYQDSGDGKEVLGMNAVFLTAFIVAFAATSLIDGMLVRASLRHLSTREDSGVVTRRHMSAGWLMVALANLSVWFFWILVYYAIQFSPSLDFDG